MMVSSTPIGYEFLPSDKELLGYYLFNRLYTRPLPFSDLEKYYVREFDLYGDLEPWEIWQRHGGDDLEDNEALYFFTPLRKVSVNGSRICRRVGTGTWAGEDSGEKIKAGKKAVGFKKRFRYENQHSPHDGAWIMHEFAIPSAPDHIVLSRLKKNLKKRNLKDANFGQSKRCKFAVPIAVQTLSHPSLIVQESEPEPEDPNLMFNPQQLLSTLEVPLPSSTIEAESNVGESDHLLDVQDNMLQPPITTTQAEADNNWVDAENGLPLSTLISSCPRDVDGREYCFWENILKHLPLLDLDDMMPTTTCFRLTIAGDSENALDAHHSMLQTPITTTQAEADYNLVAEDAMPLSTFISSSPCNVDGGDYSWENMMKDIPLPDLDDIIDIPSYNASDFWNFDVSQEMS